MRDKFWNFYQPDQSTYDDLWKSGVFVPDTNVLLALYRVRRKTREEVLSALQWFGERVFLPHQVGLEFHRNRIAVIGEQASIYRRILELLGRLQTNAGDAISSLRHDAVVSGETLSTIISDATTSAVGRIELLALQHDIRLPEAIYGDVVLDRLTALFEGRAGDPYADDRTSEIEQEARRRFDLAIPPGYMDASKPDGGVGDYLVWRQILDYAQGENRSILLVTEDQKEDWFRREQGLTVGPRPELLVEFQAETSQAIHIYSLRQFLTYAGQYQNEAVSEDAIAEVESLAEEDYSNIFGRYRDRLLDARAQASHRVSTLRKALVATELEVAAARERAARSLLVAEHNADPVLAELVARRALVTEKIADLEALIASDGDEAGTEEEIELDRLRLDIREINRRVTHPNRSAERDARKHLDRLERQVESQTKRLKSAESALASAEAELRALPSDGQ